MAEQIRVGDSSLWRSDVQNENVLMPVIFGIFRETNVI
jgi:hypothetical protein